MAENVPEKQCKVRFATARTNPKPSICWGRKSPTLQKKSWENYIVKKEKYLIEHSLGIEDLKFRKFEGGSDFPKMLAVIDAAAAFDGDESSITVEDIKNDYQHLTNSDPEKDMIFAEVDGDVVAYSRVGWFTEEKPEKTILSHFIHIHPDWRNQGIEKFMIRWCEDRLKNIAKEKPQDHPRLFQTFSNELKPELNRILEELGYQPVRYFIEMSRDLNDLPEASLPEGVDIRPVEEEDIHKIWKASIEAFRDHWGFVEPSEEDFEGYKNSKYFQPELWQVAWHGDKVVGSVLNYIDHDYNQKYNKKRGWTEEITTHRDWRRKGIAGALIVRSMKMHKAKGMDEVALGVDTNNLTGALRLYQRLGYEKEKTMMTYRKSMEDSEEK
jgi:ribosomal protein S18 acetylase RimI-like enzyme